MNPNVVYILNFAFLGAIVVFNLVTVRRIAQQQERKIIQDSVTEIQEQIENPIRERAQQTVEQEDRWELEYE